MAGKRVLVRCDLNVPMKDGKVTDATRIERSAETLKAAERQGRQGHRAVAFRPAQGQARGGVLASAAGRPLARALGRKVAFAEDCIGPAAEQAVKALKDGEVLLLENLRFHDGRRKPMIRLFAEAAGQTSAISM